MRRVVMLISVCALLSGCLLTGANAQQVAIANNDNMLDISLRDADLVQVLTALFETTGGKYKVQFGNGVTGRVAMLQLARVSFDKALDAILATDFSYTKQQQSDGVYLYKISGRNAGAGAGAARMPVFQAPAIGMPDFETSDVPSSAFMSGGAANPPLLSLGTGGAKPTAATAADTAASESSRVRLVRINYLDVGVLAEYLGGTSIDLFSLVMSSNNNNNNSGGYGNNNSRNNNNNNNYSNNNNNRNNSNNRNNNNNNRNSNNNNRNNRSNNRNNNSNNNNNRGGYNY